MSEIKIYTLKDIEKTFDLPIRKVAFLIRKGLIDPMVEGEKILVSELELLKYLKLPEEVKKAYHYSYLKTLGPGFITGAADDDPSGIGTYSAVGSAFGLSLNWLSLYLLPMMTATQETVARIGIVTGKGLSGAIGKHYGRKILYPLIFLLLIANTINIGANIGAMAASLGLLVPVNFILAAFLITVTILFLEIKFSYHNYARILKWLAISLLGYVVTVILIKPDWALVFKSLVVPEIKLNPEYLAAMVAVMGTTISPYLFFWQASEEVEEKRDKGTLSDHRNTVLKAEIKEMRKDTLIGMSFSNIIFFSIVVTCAFVFHANGVFNIESAEQAAEALRPLAGNFASFLFAGGIFAVGLLAVPVLAGSSAYGISELFKWNQGLSKKYSQAKGFYGVIIASMVVGLLMNFLGFNPIKALFWAAIVNGIVSPVLMFFIFRMGADSKIMGRHTSPLWVNFWGYSATLLMALAVIFMFTFQFFR